MTNILVLQNQSNYVYEKIKFTHPGNYDYLQPEAVPKWQKKEAPENPNASFF
jgi:hypothetical protein